VLDIAGVAESKEIVYLSRVESDEIVYVSWVERASVELATSTSVVAVVGVSEFVLHVVVAAESVVEASRNASLDSVFVLGNAIVELTESDRLAVAESINVEAVSENSGAASGTATTVPPRTTLKALNDISGANWFSRVIISSVVTGIGSKENRNPPSVLDFVPEMSRGAARRAAFPEVRTFQRWIPSCPETGSQLSRTPLRLRSLNSIPDKLEIISIVVVLDRRAVVRFGATVRKMVLVLVRTIHFVRLAAVCTT
jgi:hypothetical protein